jgi:hypothetical protein
MYKYIIISLISLILYTIYNNNNIEQFSISSRDWYDSCNNDYDCKLDFEYEYDPDGDSDCIKYLSCSCKENQDGNKVCTPNLTNTDTIYVINTNSRLGIPYEKIDLKLNREFIAMTGTFYENVKQWLINNPEWALMTTYVPVLDTSYDFDNYQELPFFYSSIHLTDYEARDENGMTIHDYMNRYYDNQNYTVSEVDLEGNNIGGNGDINERCRSKNNIDRCEPDLECMTLQDVFNIEYCVEVGELNEPCRPEDDERGRCEPRFICDTSNDICVNAGELNEHCRSEDDARGRCEPRFTCDTSNDICVNAGELNEPCRPEDDARGRCEPRFICDTSNDICVNAGEEYEPCIDAIGMRGGQYGCHDNTMSCENVQGRYRGDVVKRCIITGSYHRRCRSQEYSELYPELRRCNDQFRDGIPVVCRFKEDRQNPPRYMTCRKRKRNLFCASNPNND